jgi:RNA polymerase sigma-70 factor (ECF subfamily)
VTSDAELLEAIRKDAPGAFEAFVDRYGGRILAFGMRVCGEREDARDVLQDTLFQAYRRLRQLEHPEALRSWLYRVAANACLMRRRRGGYATDREVSLDDLRPESVRPTEIPDPSALPDAVAARRELQERLAGAVSDLPASLRIVLVMRDMEQLSTAEVAEALGIGEPAVKMRLHRARLKVRERLELELAAGRGAS